MTDDPLVLLLACAVLHPGLRGILILDASPAQLEEAAALLAAMVPVAEGRETSTCRLGRPDRTVGGYAAHMV